eukprot:16751-Eustigmatos_ZCMA.PRE.1
MSALFSAVSLALPFIEIEAFQDASRLQLARQRLELFGLLNYGADTNVEMSHVMPTSHCDRHTAARLVALMLYTSHHDC